MSYPVGNLVRARFSFTTRELTDQEQAAYMAGDGLPDGIGTSPADVLADYQPSGGAVRTLEAPDVVEDAEGAFHIIITADGPGIWKYRGRGLDDDGNAIAATEWHVFQAE